MGARRIPPSHQSITGVFPSRKNDCGIPFESGLERDLCYQLEFDEAVKAYESQPVVISYTRPSGRKCQGYPDFRIEFHEEMDRRGEIRDVKPRSQLRRKWVELRPRLKAACRYARQNGKIYRLASEVEIRDAFLPQWKFLYRYLCEKPDTAAAQKLLSALAGCGESTPKRLLEACFEDPIDQATALTTLWHLIATRAIGAHLDRTITMTSHIWAATCKNWT